MRLEVLAKRLRQERHQKRRGSFEEDHARPEPIDDWVTEALGRLPPALSAELSRLDRAQQRAVLSEERCLLVRAPVGSGKTTVLVHKVLYLHLGLGVPLEEIAVLTFTRRAAELIRTRLSALRSERPLSSRETAWMGTFHAVACALLREALPIGEFQVLEEELRESWVRGLAAELGLRLSAKSSVDRGLLRSEALRAAYREKKAAESTLDFDDLLDRATEQMHQVRFRRPRWVLVDEAQDCEARDLAFIDGLAGPEARRFFVGDPLQSIYGFRGASPERFLALATHSGARVHALEASYRSTETILHAARAVLGAQPISGGAIVPARAGGAPVTLLCHHDPTAEAIHLADRAIALHDAGTPWSEIGVLVRLNAQLPPIAEHFALRGVPFQMVASGPVIDGVNPPAGAIASVNASGPAIGGVNPPAGAIAEGVRLLTLHAAKGLEFAHVFLSGINRGLMPLLHGSTDAEERRLLFVGMTRARESLEIGHHDRPTVPPASCAPSPYLDQIPASLLDRTVKRAVPAPPPPAPAPPALRFNPGQKVRHPRYGEGEVRRANEAEVEVDFGRRGLRTFPRKLCPLSEG